jgi:hypothetical protein
MRAVCSSSGNCSLPKTRPAMARLSASERLRNVSVVWKLRLPKSGVYPTR